VDPNRAQTSTLRHYLDVLRRRRLLVLLAVVEDAFARWLATATPASAGQSLTG
jgi:hypothetical protein